MDKGLLRCKLCDNESRDEKSLGSHLQTNHKINSKNYFEKIYTKVDLLDDSLIEFKSFEQYALCDFSSNRNFKKWAETQSKNIFLDYYLNKLKMHGEFKKTKIAPSFIESYLVKYLLPNDLVEKLTGLSFCEMCGMIGMGSRFDYKKSLPVQSQSISEIIIDTREQRPFKFKDLNTISSKLEYGDYASPSNTLIAVERKSLSDLRSTLSSGFDRFCREIERAKKSGGYLIVVTESHLSDVLYQKSRFGKCQPEFISHKLRSLMRTYDNLQFVFADNRIHAQNLTVDILNWGDLVRNVDIQYFLKKWR